MKKIIGLLTVLTALSFAEPSSAQIVFESASIVPGAVLATNGTIGAALTVGEPLVGVATNGTTTIEWGTCCDCAIQSVVSVNEADAASSASIKVWPNPIEKNGRVELTLTKSADVTLRIYDATGHEIKSLFSGFRQAGVMTIDLTSEGLSAGTYFIAAEMPNEVVQARITIVK